MRKILIVEDERPISDLIMMNLNMAGYETMQVFDGISAKERIETNRFDLVLLDIMLPGMDGFELMQYIHPTHTPVIFLTAMQNVNDRVRGLKLGADDYIVKPFEGVELIARIEAVLRRYHNAENQIEFDDLVINLDERTVKKDGMNIELTLKEYELLVLLIKNKDVAMTREKILEMAWGYDYYGETRTVDIHIQKLRRKLDWNDRIKTVFKVGYRLES